MLLSALGWYTGSTMWLSTMPDSARVTTMIRPLADRKSTRLNSSHVKISYAVFCLKKKKIYVLRGHFEEIIKEVNRGAEVSLKVIDVRKESERNNCDKKIEVILRHHGSNAVESGRV